MRTNITLEEQVESFKQRARVLRLRIKVAQAELVVTEVALARLEGKAPDKAQDKELHAARRVLNGRPTLDLPPRRGHRTSSAERVS